MDIYLVRHAIAEEIGKGGAGDTRRALTPEGRRKMKEASAGFARMEPQIERIFSSPLVRAWQTAEIVADSLKHKKEIQAIEELAPGHTPQEVLERLRNLRNVKSVLLAGHEPNCSQLASYLLGGTASVDLEFKKGAICLIQDESLNPGSGILIWLLPPAALRLMAG